MFEVIEVGGTKTVAAKNIAVNHVYVVDVSGSMMGSLPKMRQHLKNTVSMVTNPDDTFSIIYFSGRGQCGIVCEEVSVADIGSVTSIQQTIDRWLAPIGLTGFAEPISMANDLHSRLSANGKAMNFVMLTDGYDNQSKRSDILSSCETLGTLYDSVAFIEYGWFCDRDLLKNMCELAGGIHIFADGIQQYETRFEETISNEGRASKISVSVNKKAKHAVYIHNNQIVIANVEESHTVNIPETVDLVYAIVPKDVLQKQLSTDRLYIILYYAAKMDNSKLVWRCLEALGDIALIDAYNNAFTRQELTEFEDLAKDAVLSPDTRYTEGKDTSYLPPEDASTVLDFLGVLSTSDDVGMVTDSRFFEYNRTSAARKQTDELPAFEEDTGKVKKVNGLVFNSTRANVSIQTQIEGVVEVPENEWDLKFIPSKQIRNYTIIRDGILNIPKLDLVIDQKTHDALKGMGASMEVVRSITDDGKVRVVLDLSRHPVISRQMVNDVTLGEFRETVSELFYAQGVVKGLKHHLPKGSKRFEGLADEYGEDAAKWLSSIGVRDYGFSPKVTSEKSGDVYMATEVSYKAKGLSSLPSTNAVMKKVEANKPFTISEFLVHNGINRGMTMSEDAIKKALETEEANVKDLQENLSSMVYALIISKSWFEGEDDVVETELNYGKYSAKLTITTEKKEIAI